MATTNQRLFTALEQLVSLFFETARERPFRLFFLLICPLTIVGIFSIYLLLHLLAPKPRLPYPSEKTYITTNPDGTVSDPRPLPCWFDRWRAESRLKQLEKHPNSVPEGFPVPYQPPIEPAEVEISVVVPAYNEAERIEAGLAEMVEYLDATFGRPFTTTAPIKNKNSRPSTPHRIVFKSPSEQAPPPKGYEILIINDGSSDNTVDVCLKFSAKHSLHDIIRIVTLAKNRGKGGGVTHGLRHVRGRYAVFADADGASKFSDLGRLIEGCEDVVDGSNRGVAIGSRAHLVGSEAVVKRSAVRNFLMRSFHFVLMILTPPATSRIRDTQCGFKLFSRAALPHIVPYMHAEGWIFDIEMLMLAESAPATPVLNHEGEVIGTSAGIKVAEVPVGWHEVEGSKMNLVKDSVRMAVGLAVLRASWMFGVYRRRLT
ncbi:glycosyltransferase [Podospora fimiseda]|uniref:dolichyl-phosphate beta-glucosyltransferase n=1 Tax=Podospora fimiseda TaxID=252190 RepID=A0AAN7BYN2_9PEZI|nr:glycosyltransferase [Podospora fimiseda]